MSTVESPEPAPRISRDWPLFESRLASVLAALREDQFLILPVKQSARFIQFAGQGAFGMRAEVSSNAFLPAADRLTDEQIGKLLENGWAAPTGSAKTSTPERDPDGSPNFFIDFASPVEPQRIAALAVRTLIDVLGLPHPGFLEYMAFDTDGNALVFATLGIKHAPAPDRQTQDQRASQLLATVSRITGIGDLSYDIDGNIGIRFGDVSVFIRLLDNPVSVRLFAPLVIGVQPTPELYAYLNDINVGMGHMHVCHKHDVIAAISVFPMLPSNDEVFADALRRFCEIADGLDDPLAAQFDGRSLRIGGEPRTVH